MAGIAVGNGTGSGPGRPARGVAPLADLVVESMLDATGGFGAMPPLIPMHRPLRDAYELNGARVHTNSWGRIPGFGLGNYTFNTTARITDEFIWRNPDFVVLFCVMNGATDGPFNGVAGPGADGTVDFGSLSPESTARNGIWSAARRARSTPPEPVPGRAAGATRRAEPAAAS